jgi:hypothetical protein
MDAWQKALDDFHNSLDAEDRTIFGNSRLEHLQQDLARCDELYRRNSTPVPISAKLQPLLYGMEQYGKATEVPSAHSPGGIPQSPLALPCSPLWGAMRVLIKVRKRKTTSHVANKWTKYVF